MSGPISPSEIEDVVSSMRRLMALEPRPRSVSRDLGQDRLVLTPSLRVVPDGESEPPLILTPDASLTATEPVPPADRVAEPPAATIASTPDPLGAATPDKDLREAFEAEWEDEIWAAPEAPLAELALEVEEAELMPDPPPGAVQTTATADASDPLDVEAPWVEVGEDWLDDLDVQADPIIAFVAAERNKAGKDSAAPAADQILPAEPRDLNEDSDATVEPVSETAEAVAEMPPSATDEPADSEPVVAEPEAATVADPSADDAPADQAQSEPRLGVLELSAADLLTDGEGNPLTVLDEAALQLIIRQLIREELKGVLGEKITQSVRKLVRAEINRALAAHALD